MALTQDVGLEAKHVPFLCNRLHGSAFAYLFHENLQQRAGKPNCAEIIGILLHRSDNSTVKPLFQLKKVDRRWEGGIRQLQDHFGVWD